jgi:hypothetical protein
VFGQDGNAVREFGRLNVVDHAVETKIRALRAPRLNRGLNPSTPQNEAANDLIYG